MKIYLQGKGMVLVGKSWEIRHKLEQYAKEYDFVKDWIHDERKKNKLVLRITGKNSVK